MPLWGGGDATPLGWNIRALPKPRALPWANDPCPFGAECGPCPFGAVGTPPRWGGTSGRCPNPGRCPGLTTHAPSGRNADRAPSGRNADRAPSGRNPDHAPSGRNADHAPSGRNPDRAPSGRNADRAPSGRDQGVRVSQPNGLTFASPGERPGGWAAYRGCTLNGCRPNAGHSSSRTTPAYRRSGRGGSQGPAPPDPDPCPPAPARGRVFV
jgi:hypothetical protein